MVMEDMILTASELRFVMDDIKEGAFSPNFVENSVPVQQLLNETSENNAGFTSSQTSDTSGEASECRPAKRKKMKRACDSTQNVGSTSSLLGNTLPCLEAYPGTFHFQLQLPADSSTHRWTYSKVLKKVFIDIDKVLALQFRWNFNDVKNDVEMFVRAMPVYTSDDSLNAPVLRCPIHKLPDNPLNAGFLYLDHVMRCEHSSTSYEKDASSQRLSCRTPLSRPQPGSDTTTLTYKFVCKTSCLGGMNRKPISVIFTLEDARGCEYGRQKLAVKICSCPKRDKMKEEKNEIDKNEPTTRLSNANESVPSVVCTLNNSVASTALSEQLRDIKAGVYLEQIARCVSGLENKVDKILKHPMFHEENSFSGLKKYLKRKMVELPLAEQNELRDMIQEGIEGLNPYVAQILILNMYDTFLGKTIRCNWKDSDDLLSQLQTQIDDGDRPYK